LENTEEKIKTFNQEAKIQAQKNHSIYEKSWKDKSRQAKKEVDELKKEQKRIENNIKNKSKQKTQEIFKLKFELENEVKMARQPILDLEVARDAKMLVFKQKTETLLKQEKPVVEGIRNVIKRGEVINVRFEMLGIRDQQLKSPALFHVPFYVACYQAGLSKRYFFLPPSTAGPVGFANKFKGVLGRSKIKELFIPRFKEITALIDKVHDVAKQDSWIDNEIRDTGEKNNLLKTELTRNVIAKGLTYLKHDGWLSDKEYQTLNSTL
jgi:hypothetical protein